MGDNNHQNLQKGKNISNEAGPKYYAQCYEQKQTLAESLELTYSHLGRLMHSAEMLAYKLNLFENNQEFKYQIYDTFEVAEKKGIDTLKYDVINHLDFYEKAIILHTKSFYKYENPSSTAILINDLKNWFVKAAPEDKRFFKCIIDLINNGKYDYSAFPDENILYEKAKLDSTQFQNDAGFWKTFSIPVLQFLKDLSQKIKDNLNINPNYKPDFKFGPKPSNNKILKESLEYKNKEKEINSKLNEVNKILLDINNKKGNLKLLGDSAEKLNLLIISFKKKYGDDLELDPNSLMMLNSLLSTINIDKKIMKKLNDIKINIDPNSVV
jgi:hypothetical protein